MLSSWDMCLVVALHALRTRGNWDPSLRECCRGLGSRRQTWRKRLDRVLRSIHLEPNFCQLNQLGPIRKWQGESRGRRVTHSMHCIQYLALLVWMLQACGAYGSGQIASARSMLSLCRRLWICSWEVPRGREVGRDQFRVRSLVICQCYDSIEKILCIIPDWYLSATSLLRISAVLGPSFVGSNT